MIPTQKTLIIFVILFGVLLAGCLGDAEDPAADDAEATLEGVAGLVSANNQFAFEVYSELKGDGENVFLSPWSISTALAMVYEGTRGETAEEIRDVFHFPAGDTDRRSSFASLYNQINRGDASYTLSTANALWAQQDYQFLQDYISTIEDYYVGKTTNLDFVTDTENSRQTINTWVEEQTNDKIKDLFPPGSLDSMTRLVLTNAIYFKGTWLKQFDPEDTYEAEFRVSPGNTVTVDMMRQTDEVEFNYAETEDLQILEMLYDGEELSMLVLLPKNDDMDSLESMLDPEKLVEWRGGLREQEVDVYFPKFTFTTKYFMSDTLASMGMPLAFIPFEADLSGMDGTRDLFITTVIHQAFVDVNEEGTEAAAATGVGVGTTSVPPPTPVFRADHPFIFIILEKETGSILFLGKVVDPTAS